MSATVTVKSNDKTNKNFRFTAQPVVPPTSGLRVYIEWVNSGEGSTPIEILADQTYILGPLNIVNIEAFLNFAINIKLQNTSDVDPIVFTAPVDFDEGDSDLFDKTVDPTDGQYIDDSTLQPGENPPIGIQLSYNHTGGDTGPLEANLTIHYSINGTPFTLAFTLFFTSYSAGEYLPLPLPQAGFQTMSWLPTQNDAAQLLVDRCITNASFVGWQYDFDDAHAQLPWGLNVTTHQLDVLASNKIKLTVVVQNTGLPYDGVQVRPFGRIWLMLRANKDDTIKITYNYSAAAGIGNTLIACSATSRSGFSVPFGGSFSHSYASNVVSANDSFVINNNNPNAVFYFFELFWEGQLGPDTAAVDFTIENLTNDLNILPVGAIFKAPNIPLGPLITRDLLLTN